MADMHHPEDLRALDVSWWYIWGWWTSNGAIPMLRRWEIPPSCAPYILVGNEPDSVEPYGYPMTPLEAVNRTHAIESVCPHSIFIIGNVTQDGAEWLSDYLAYYPDYSGSIGVHCYQWTEGVCRARLAELRALYSGDMWVTEFNDLSGEADNFHALLEYISTYFSRYAVFTNRYYTGPTFHGAPLIVDGLPDARGLIYTEW